MAFTPAGMFYLSNEDLAPSMDMMGGGIRGMLGVQNEEEAIMSLAKNYDITDLNQREDFFAAVRQINPRMEVQLRKEAQEWDKGQKDLMPTPSKPSANIEDFKFAKLNGYKGTFKEFITKEANNKPTNNIQEYEYAKKKDGYTGTLTDWLKANASKGDFTTAQKDIRDIAKFDLKCNIKEGTCYKNSEEIYIARKRKTSGEDFHSAFGKAQGAAFSEDVTKSISAAEEARFYGSTIDQSMELLDEGLYTGVFAPTIQQIRKIGAAFGWTDPGKTASAEQFTVNSMKAIMAWVQKTKGAISEAEMRLFANASEGLERTVGGNRLILLTARKLATYIDAKDGEMNRWLLENPDGRRSAWQAHLREWNKENGNVVPTQAEIDAALNTESISVFNSSSGSNGSSGLNYTVEKIQQ